jgi:hypothetical protein
MGNKVLSNLTKKIIKLFAVKEKNRKNIIMMKGGFTTNSE